MKVYLIYIEDYRNSHRGFSPMSNRNKFKGKNDNNKFEIKRFDVKIDDLIKSKKKERIVTIENSASEYYK